ISSVVLAFFVSLASADSDWDTPLQFCATKALGVADHAKCHWRKTECYKKNEKNAMNISRFMCTPTFNVRKLGDFCCNEKLDEVLEIVRHASVSRRRRSKKTPKSSSSEFDRWISSYLP
ncbi:hypothetical protein PENTCL1PPCAC_2657, partial [Pristionchus entomophagus]